PSLPMNRTSAVACPSENTRSMPAAATSRDAGSNSASGSSDRSSSSEKPASSANRRFQRTYRPARSRTKNSPGRLSMIASVKPFSSSSSAWARACERNASRIDSLKRSPNLSSRKATNANTITNGPSRYQTPPSPPSPNRLSPWSSGAATTTASAQPAVTRRAKRSSSRPAGTSGTKKTSSDGAESARPCVKGSAEAASISRPAASEAASRVRPARLRCTAPRMNRTTARFAATTDGCRYPRPNRSESTTFEASSSTSRAHRKPPTTRCSWSRARPTAGTSPLNRPPLGDAWAARARAGRDAGRRRPRRRRRRCGRERRCCWASRPLSTSPVPPSQGDYITRGRPGGYDNSRPGAQPPHRLLGELVEGHHRHLEVLLLGVLDLVVRDAVEALHEEHHRRHARARDLRGVVQRTARQAVRHARGLPHGLVGQLDQLGVERHRVDAPQAAP